MSSRVRTLLENDQFSKFLLVARDVTDSVHSEAFEQSTREQHELVTRLLQDKQGFAQFVKDAEVLLSALDSERDLTLMKRHLHTLKGNVSLFGLASLAELCHSVEDQISETGELPSAKHIADLASLWRNAVDHGAEPEAERVASGKPKAMLLELITERTDNGFAICVRDDGRGVDRSALLRAARRSHPSVRDDASLEELMFLDGVSSRDEVTQTSGRGVGLSAVRQACLAEGGQLELSTTPGRGTTFRFLFRVPIVKPGALAARLERRWSLSPPSDMPANQQVAVSSRARGRSA